MKRQSSFHEKGFTLVEIMLTIVLLSIIFMAISSFWGISSRESKVRAERLADQVSRVIHDGLLNITIGKSEGWVVLTGAVIRIESATWSVSTWVVRYQYGDWQPFKSISLLSEDPNYKIEKIFWYGWVNGASGTTDSVKILMDTMSGSFADITDPNSQWATEIRVRVRYMDYTKLVIFDRRTGRIEIK